MKLISDRLVACGLAGLLVACGPSSKVHDAYAASTPAAIEATMTRGVASLPFATIGEVGKVNDPRYGENVLGINDDADAFMSELMHVTPSCCSAA